jgi:hypothetical protein
MAALVVHNVAILDKARRTWMKVKAASATTIFHQTFLFLNYCPIFA